MIFTCFRCCLIVYRELYAEFKDPTMSQKWSINLPKDVPVTYCLNEPQYGEGISKRNVNSFSL